MALPPPTTTTTDPDSLVMIAAEGKDSDGDGKDSQTVGIENGIERKIEAGVGVGVKEALKVPVVEIASVNNDNGDDEGEETDEDEDAEGDEGTEGEDEDEDEEDEWEDEDELSLFEELIDGVEDQDENTNENDRGGYDNQQDRFSPSESLHLRKRLRLIGESRFLRETIGHDGSGGGGGGGGGKCTAKKLCTAFGLVRPPLFLEGAPDEAYYTLLSVCISRELRRRVKLQEWNTIDDAVELLKGRGKVVVLTGAGISTSLGIPDFRSKDTGLYARLEHLGLSDPQEVFDIHLFHQDPSIFYSVAKDILPSSKKYTPTHAFIRLLQDKGKLLTNFTQNIDNLEEFAGIEKERLVQCHGSFATATCIECRHQVECEAIYEDLKAGKVAHCEDCLKRIRRPITTTTQQQSSCMKRKRSSDGASSDVKSQTISEKKKKKTKRKKQDYEDSTTDDDDNNDDHLAAVTGVMKPDITFFGEDLPPRFHDRLINHDRDQVDLVLVIGTSLKVAPVSEVVGVIPPHVPQIYISREPCKHVEFDIDLLGDCDTVVQELCRRAGWDLRHEMIGRSENGQGDADEVVAAAVELVEGHHSRWSMKSPTATAAAAATAADLTKADTNGIEHSSLPLPLPPQRPPSPTTTIDQEKEGLPAEVAAVHATAG